MATEIENGVATMAIPSVDAVEDISLQKLEQLAEQLTAAVKAYKESGTAGKDDVVHRKQVNVAAQAVLNATKIPDEQWNEYSVLMAEVGAIRCWMDWKAFDIMPAEGSITYKELAEKLEADELLVTRMAWIMVCTGTLEQIGEDRIAHTHLSRVYSHGHPSGVLFQVMFDEAMLPYANWQRYFAQYGRKEPTSPFVNPHTFGYNSVGTHFWELIYNSPQRSLDFMQSMNTLEKLLQITGIYDFSWLVEKSKQGGDIPLFVDVGGGKGQALAAILKENPGLDGSRCVIQDRPDIIKLVEEIGDPELKDVKKQAHDFYTEQPVKGAWVYYIRRCMHDFSDENCSKILQHLRDAMPDEGRVLICEQILSNPPSKLGAQTDLCMLNLGGKERSPALFEKIVTGGGLKVQKIWRSETSDVGVVECVKA